MAAPKTKTKNGGAKPGGGRPLGSRNQLTIDVKKAIIAAFDKAGGERWLAALARDEPRTFATLLAKIVPSETINDSFARAAHPHSRPISHDWGPPMPGAGRMMICRRCGAKETASSRVDGHPTAECSGYEPVSDRPSDTEYDPFNE